MLYGTSIKMASDFSDASLLVGVFLVVLSTRLLISIVLCLLKAQGHRRMSPSRSYERYRRMA